jgi:GT2 family glycosyltransferase
MLSAAARHPRAGVIGPRLLNQDGSLQRSAWPFPTARRLLLEAFLLHRPLRAMGVVEDLGVWNHDEERAVDFLVGACLLIRSAALAEVGGFDEEFWLYAEEADLERRLSRRGWEVVLAPLATAVHVGSASSTTSTTRLRHFYLGQRRYLRKHGNKASWPVARIALVLGSALRGRWAAVRVGASIGASGEESG